MLNIVCVNAGDFESRGSEYVNILFDMVRRNLAEGYEGRFVCFTDNPEGLDPFIESRELPKGLNGWWNKLYLFKSGLFDEGDRIVYFDLDTVITGRLDEICAYSTDFAILRDFYHGDEYDNSVFNTIQSAVMMWKSGYGSHIWDNFVKAGYPNVVGGDQVWIENEVSGYEILQDIFPGLFCSFKASGERFPKTESVVCFHGRPRPHEVIEGWVPKVWKIGGFARAELDTFCNVENEKIHANIRHCISLGLTTVSPSEDHDDHVCIVAGGPSLEDSLDEIREMRGFGHKVWSLNNTHDWLIERGIVPDASVMLDARPENAAFLKNARNDVQYYIASQCHKDVFSALHGRKVITFHNATEGAQEVLEPITDGNLYLLGGGTTVGMKAIVLARFMGYRHFHLYGFDSSYREGRGHAYPQHLNDNDRVLDVSCDGRDFKCAPWMITQANDFIELAGMLTEQDCILTVAGDGLIPHIARQMARPRLNAADIRAIEILKRLWQPNPVGAEIGVFAADLSKRLLSNPDITLYMVDSWSGDGKDYVGDSGDWHAKLTQKKQDQYYEKSKRRVEKFGDRARIIRKPSTEAAKDIKDSSLDFIFIDADHSYDGCRADIDAWWPKVRPGGLFGGHDYENSDYQKFGVSRAVNEFVRSQGLTLDLGGNFTWFVIKPSQKESASA